MLILFYCGNSLYAETGLPRYKKNPPEKYYVKFIVAPDSADIYLDGIYFGKSYSEYYVEEGVHSLMIIKDTYLSIESVINIRSDKKNLFTFNLSRRVGVLSLSVIPSDAIIKIDGNTFRGSEPDEIVLSPGKHILLIEKSGYFSEMDTFTIAAYERVSKKITLVELPEICLSSEGEIEVRYLDSPIISLKSCDDKYISYEKYFLFGISDDKSVAPEYSSIQKDLFVKFQHKNDKVIYYFGKPVKVLNNGQDRILSEGDSVVTPSAAFVVSSQASEIKTNSQKIKEIKEYSIIVASRPRLKTLFQSAICPGLGQFNSGRKTTGAIIACTFFSALIWDIINLSRYNNEKSNLKSKLSIYRKDPDFSVRQQLAIEINQRYGDLSPKYSLAVKSHIITGAIYLINIIDAVFSGSTKKEVVSGSGLNFFLDCGIENHSSRGSISGHFSYTF